MQYSTRDGVLCYVKFVRNAPNSCESQSCLRRVMRLYAFALFSDAALCRYRSSLEIEITRKNLLFCAHSMCFDPCARFGFCLDERRFRRVTFEGT